jgi:RecA-family ATPase
MCVAIATGEEFWGYKVNKSPVLYLALEDTSDSISRRIHDQGLKHYDLGSLHLGFEVPALHSGFEDYIANYISSYPDTKLVVVDIFADIRDTVENNKQTQYYIDKQDMKKLRSIAQKYGITIVLVHHSTKMEHDNAINSISGTNGLMGGTDGNWILERPKPEETRGKITMNNRHSKSACFDLDFDEETLKWNNLGKHSTASIEEEDLLILIDNWLENDWEGTSTDLVEELKKIDSNFSMSSTSLSKYLRKILHKLKSHEKIELQFKRKIGKKFVIFKRISS